MAFKRPVSILKYNAAQMARQGASDAEIDAYLADNGANKATIDYVPMPDEAALQKALDYEKSDKFQKNRQMGEEAQERGERARRNLDRLAYAQGVTRDVAQGLLYGFGEELESALTGQDVNEIRNEMRAWDAEHPVAAIGSTIAGAVANPLGGVGGAAKGASLGEKVLRGGMQGLAQGAVYGYGAGEGGVENRLESAAESGVISGALGAAMPAAVEGAKWGGRRLGEALGLTTGTGNAVSQAYQAGAAGDDALLASMRGEGNIQDVVTEAKQAAQNIRQDAMNKYRVAMEGLPDETINVKGVKNAINDAIEDNMLNKGVVDKTADKFLREAKSQMSKLTRGTKNKVSVRDVDKIKQAIQSIDVPLEARNAQRIKTNITNALRAEIKEAAPVYTKIMKDYSEVAGKLKEIDKVLSLSPGQSADTAVRKLQSLMREGVETNYGNRVALADYLERVGGANIKNKIAGQSLSSVVPRGMVARGLAGASGLSAMANPTALVGLATASPRLVGETAYKLGQISRALDKLPQTRVPAYALTAASKIEGI